MNQARVTVVVPAYNEEKNISLLFAALQQALAGYNFDVIYIDDGSKDNTLAEIRKLAAAHPEVKYISFSRNFGHQNALKAGLDKADGDCVISMDADMQHPPELIKDMIARWQEGFDIVYTIRDDQNTSFVKRATAAGFYKLVNLFSDVEIVPGAADFRLMDKKVVAVFRDNIQEYYLFVRGLVSWVGFKQYALTYVPNKRLHGKTKYSFRKMLSFAANGLTSFSAKPLRLAMYFGFLISALSFLYGIYAVYMSMFTDRAVLGWGSVIISVLFIGGVQMLLIGILGEYLGKMFFESKRRPHYIVKDTNC